MKTFLVKTSMRKQNIRASIRGDVLFNIAFNEWKYLWEKLESIKEI